jgi:cytochrome c-type biogenesis protein CcmH/NrfG
MPRSFPSATPRSFPSATPRSPEPRSTPTPFPRSTPNPLPNQPGQDPGRSAPRSAPRPIDEGRYRVPGENRSAPRGNPAPLPSSSDSSPSLPRGVGGSVRTVDRGANTKNNGPALRPRDIYDDTMARPKPSGMPQPKAGDRPTTTRSLADRYSVDPSVRSRATPGAAPLDPGATSKPRGASAQPRTPVVDRYAARPVAKPDVRTAGPTNRVAPTGVAPDANRPALMPRTRTTGGTLTAPRGGVPRLVPRTTTGVLCHPNHFHGSCFGPVWDPCCSWGCWSNSCSPCLTWCLGIGSGSFCWGWSSWWPWHCWSSCHSFSSCWWPSWGCASPIWWWPNYCYTPSYLYTPYYAPTYAYAEPEYQEPQPSTVVVHEEEAKPDDTIVVGGHRDLTPAERAHRYLDLGDFYFREGRFREAADTYAKARSLQPEDATLHFVLADAEFALGDYHFAAYLIGEALRLDPALARAETDKRLLYGDPKVFDQQVATLVRYLDDKPFDAMAHLVLGYNLKFSGNKKDAEKAFRRVLELDPASTAAQLLLDSLTASPTDDKAPDAPQAPKKEEAKEEVKKD